MLYSCPSDYESHQFLPTSRSNPFSSLLQDNQPISYPFNPIIHAMQPFPLLNVFILTFEVQFRLPNHVSVTIKTYISANFELSQRGFS